MDNYLDVLRAEFVGLEDNAFLIQLRINLKWDSVTFNRLIEAMRTYCENHGEETQLERWLAEGFWYISDFTPNWTAHPNFRQRNPDVDYNKAYDLLDEMAFWFFTGHSPYCK